MKIQKFEDLIAWQKAQDLAVLIYSLFSNHHDKSFKNQICAAAVSVSNNIAEGFDRGSKNTFIHFLRISSGSCSEVKSMIYLAQRLHYLSQEMRDSIVAKCSEISKIITGLIKSLQNNGH